MLAPSPDELSSAVARLENRCQALEGSLRAKSDAADADVARAKVAEGRFERLLAWARTEEGRRREAEERLRRACVAGEALEVRIKVVEEEVRALWGHNAIQYRVWVFLGPGRALTVAWSTLERTVARHVMVVMLQLCVAIFVPRSTQQCALGETFKGLKVNNDCKLLVSVVVRAPMREKILISTSTSRRQFAIYVITTETAC